MADLAVAPVAADLLVASRAPARCRSLRDRAQIEITVIEMPQPRSFVIAPFDASGKRVHDAVQRALKEVGVSVFRADHAIQPGAPWVNAVTNAIRSSDFLVVDITRQNPNVFYELGLAHALEKPVVLVSSNEADVPFDLGHIRVIYYDMNDPFWGTKLIDKVAENILSAISNPEEAIFRIGT